MAGSSNNSVFVQVQGVLNEDWISSSNRKLTEVLEEIEKVEGVEIRFQRGAHVVFGTVDQLLEVQGLLLGKARASSSKETSSRNPSKDLETGGELETDSHDGLDPVKAFVEAERAHKAQPMRELMVDRDIWEYIESKKQNDVRQLEDVFDAVITKVEDESGVLKLILKTKSRNDNFDFELVLESLGDLYRDTAISCVTEIAQFPLSDEERELAMEHISAHFSEVLVKNCTYSNDVLFIGPLYDAREARHQFQVVARRLVKGELRTPADKRGQQLDYPKYLHEHPPSGINPSDYEEAGLSPFDRYSNRFNGPHNDQQHDMHEKHDFHDQHSWKKKLGKDDGLKSNLSKKHLQYPAIEEHGSDTGTVQKYQMASHDPRLKTKGSNSKTEDTISSLENLNLEEAYQGKDGISKASKSNADDLSSSLSADLDEIQQQHAVATGSTVLTKANRKTKKMKSHSYDLPKVAIVKQKFEAVCDPSTVNEPSVSSDGRKVESGLSFKAADPQQVGKSTVPKDDEKHNTQEVSTQETIQSILEIVENSENKVNVKELVERDAGNHIATENLKTFRPPAPVLKEVYPQPANGTIACIIDKGFHLNGCPKSGTIEISMTFEAGIQGADQPEPGRPYRGMKLKAFLPASGDGREVLRLTRSAFAARKLFRIKRNEFEGENDIIIPNGVLFKEATDQFPDPDYLPNVIEQLKRLTE